MPNSKIESRFLVGLPNDVQKQTKGMPNSKIESRFLVYKIGLHKEVRKQTKGRFWLTSAGAKNNRTVISVQCNSVSFSLFFIIDNENQTIQLLNLFC